MQKHFYIIGANDEVDKQKQNTHKPANIRVYT